jgi:peptide/nickel transport system permease protein
MLPRRVSLRFLRDIHECRTREEGVIKLKYIIQRVLYTIPVFLVVALLIFIMTRVMPGDPARMYAGETAPEYVVENIRESMGLSKSLPEQFLLYLRGLSRGDFGYAWHTEHPVIQDFAQRFPASLELTVFSLLVAILIGIPLGILSSIHKNSFVDHLSRTVSLLGASMPVFWLGLILIILLYGKAGWVPAPVGRIGRSVSAPVGITGLYILDSLLVGDFAAFKSSLSQILLPGIALSFSSLAMLSRMTRSSMLEVLNLDYVRTARAKGLRECVVVLQHAFSNALIPVLTVLGGQFGMLLGHAVVVETIFAWPGVGSYVTDSILMTDYAPVQAFALFSAVLYVLINLALDILYTIVDPRVRYE